MDAHEGFVHGSKTCRRPSSCGIRVAIMDTLEGSSSSERIAS